MTQSITREPQPALSLTAQLGPSGVIISPVLAGIGFRCRRVVAMCEGAIVEEGDVEEILAARKHCYTKN